MPAVTDVVTIDGYTQPGASPNTFPLAQGTNAVLQIEVSGAALAAESALTWAADGGRIQGLVMNRCPFGTIHVTGSVTITGNFLGTTPQGGPLTDGSPQNRAHLRSRRPDGARRRPTSSSADRIRRTAISSRVTRAVQLSEGVRGQFYTRLIVQGNLIGVDATASYTISNGIGIFSGATPPVRIGGAGPNEGNVIGGSLSAGVFGSPEIFQGNFIGNQRHRDGESRKPRRRARRQPPGGGGTVGA